MGSNPAIPTIDLRRRAASCGPPFPFLKVVMLLDTIMRMIGYGLCHQIPERSFFGGGVQLPVCARDTGIYIGFAVSLAVITLLHRPDRPRGFASWPGWLVSGVLVAFMAWDGLTSYGGLRESTNLLRLLTGVGTGYAASLMVAPMMNDVLWRTSNPGRVLDPVWRLGAWVATMPVLAAAVWWGGSIIGVAYPFLVSLAIVFTFVSINLVIVGMLPRFDRRAERIRDLVAPVVGAFVLMVAEMGGAALFRHTLERLAG